MKFKIGDRVVYTGGENVKHNNEGVWGEVKWTSDDPHLSPAVEWKWSDGRFCNYSYESVDAIKLDKNYYRNKNLKELLV